MKNQKNKVKTHDPKEKNANVYIDGATGHSNRLFGRSYWRDVAVVSVLASLGVISGMINYIGDSDRPLFANAFLSLLYLVSWCAWGAFSVSRRSSRHPVRVLYSAWAVLSAVSALSMLLLSCFPGGDAFLQSNVGGAIGNVMFALCMPLYGICFFGSDGYVINDILLFAVSSAAVFLPHWVKRIRSKRF